MKPVTITQDLIHLSMLTLATRITDHREGASDVIYYPTTPKGRAKARRIVTRLAPSFDCLAAVRFTTHADEEGVFLLAVRSDTLRMPT